MWLMRFLLILRISINSRRNLKAMNHKLAMALEAADLLPWRYNLAEGKIIYESKVHPGDNIETAEVHTHEVSLKEYFSKIHPSFRACVEKASMICVMGNKESTKRRLSGAVDSGRRSP